MPGPQYILTLSCTNRRGIVAGVSTYLFEHHCNILDAQQFDDTQAGRFFMRVCFDGIEPEAFAPLHDRFRGRSPAGSAWTGRCGRWRRRSVSWCWSPASTIAWTICCTAGASANCRWRWSAIVSNHPRETYAHIDFDGVPFHHLPVTRLTKLEQETQLWHLIREARVDVVVLARYMQILSDGLSAKLAGRCINIHHSFLPGFKGARAYHQAHERGVKLIGATAHYVTSDLDEGPIIEQDVERISHRDTPEDLVRKGRDIERRVLARALRHHLEDRVLLHGRKTVVFTE